MDSLKDSPSPEAKLHFLDYWRISRVRIAIEKDEPDVPGLLSSGTGFKSYDPFYLQTEFEKIQSQSILDPVVTNLQLNVKWAKKYGQDSLRVDEARIALKNRVVVKQSRNTSLIEIWVYSDDKQEAADIANQIASVYKTNRLAQRTQAKIEGIKTFRLQVEAKEAELRAKEAEVSALRATNNIPDVEASSAQSMQTIRAETIRQLERNREDAFVEYNRWYTLLTNIQALSRADLKNALPTALPDSELSALLESLSISEQKLAQQSKYYGEEHQEVKAAKAVVEKAEKQIKDKIGGILQGLETRVKGFKQHLDALTAAAEAAEARDILETPQFQSYFNAKNSLEALRRVRDALNLRLEQETVEVKLPTTSMVEVIDEAEPGLKPVGPHKPRNIGLGTVVGLMLGVGLAFFIEYLDTSVKTIDDVERALQAPVLGVIPQNVGSLLDEGPESPHAEAYRVLRTNILFSRKDDTWNTLSVVSGGAGEGKSTTLFNLATVFAQNGNRVLVVDSDLRRPSLHKILRLSNSVGLTNYLLKQNTLEEVVQTTKLPTLDFLPSGKLPSSSMGILSSTQMKALISEVKRRYDFVFFDSPPIMGVSDASILASEVDMCLQVIQYRRYPQIMTIRAKQMIQNVGGHLLGIVLNNINMSSDENYYYYSGYYYDYYSKQDDGPEVKGSDSGAKKEKEAKLDLKSKY